MDSSAFGYDYWAKLETRVDFIPANQIPKHIPVTAVKLFYFTKNRLLLVKIPSGWDIPGGHIEREEDMHVALKREILEETGGRPSKTTLVGYLKTTKIRSNEANTNYPDSAAIAIFVGEVVGYKNKELTHESFEVGLFEVTELSSVLPFWKVFYNNVINYLLSKSAVEHM